MITIEWFYDHQANFNARSGGSTLLIDCVKTYEESDCDDKNRWTIYIPKEGAKRLMKALLRGGADPTVIDDSGKFASNYTTDDEVRKVLLSHEKPAKREKMRQKLRSGHKKGNRCSPYVSPESS